MGSIEETFATFPVLKHHGLKRHVSWKKAKGSMGIWGDVYVDEASSQRSECHIWGVFFGEFLGISLDVTLVDEQKSSSRIVILSPLHFAHRDFLRIFRLLTDS